MRSLVELGIGLSVVFCVFVLALVAELCYIFYWKRSKLAKSTSGADCLKCTAAGRQHLHGSSPEFVREASLVGSFGGYPSSVLSAAGIGVLGSDASCGESLLHSSSDPRSHLLFSIKEETKEDMELATAGAGGLGGTIKPNSGLRSRTPSDVLTIHFTSGSSSPVDTDPFTTPPSSPPRPPTERLPKLSPFAACAVRPLSCGKSPSPIAEMHTLSAGCQGPSSPATNGRGRMSLQLLFERSPLLIRAWPQSPAAAHLPSPLRSTSLSLPGAAETFDASPPPFYHSLSLGALFRQSSSPCLPFSASN